MAETRTRCLAAGRRAAGWPSRAGGPAARRWAATRSGETDRAPAPAKERVVILGSGWAGYALARKLPAAKATRILISPRSHFVFTPLVASTAVGTLEFRAAIEPVRRLGLAEFHEARAVDVDFAAKTVRVEAAARADGGGDGTDGGGGGASSFDVPYDRLVLAVGCRSQTFGIDGVAEHACFLRDVADARAIRLRVLGAFERASLPTADAAARRRLLHFAVVGGGPTGVEFAAELHDLVHEDLARLYPRLAADVAISVYDVAPTVLPMFDRSLAAYAADVFARQGIAVRTGHRLDRIRRHGDVLLLRVRGAAAGDPVEVPAGLVVWSTGLAPHPLVGRLAGREVRLGPGGAAPARVAVHGGPAGGFVTDAHMRVQLTTTTTTTTTTMTTLPDVYAIGDCAAIRDNPLPATAQVASQQAAYLARRLSRRPGPDDDGPPFRFRNLGTMAYLGGWRAIHQSRADELRGWPAWLLWRTAYLTRSMSLRNKLLVPVYWLATWLFGRDISRF